MSLYQKDYPSLNSLLSPKTHSYSPFHKIFNISKRSIYEQILGYFILICTSLTSYVAVYSYSNSDLGYSRLIHIPYCITENIYLIGWPLFYFTTSSSMWLTWRHISSKIIKLEITLFLSQLLLSFFWLVMITQTQEYLLSFINILFLLVSQILSVITYWKNDKLASILLMASLTWVFCMAIINFELCTITL